MNAGRHGLSLLLSRFVAPPGSAKGSGGVCPGSRSQANTPSLASGCHGVYLMRLLLLFWASPRVRCTQFWSV